MADLMQQARELVEKLDSAAASWPTVYASDREIISLLLAAATTLDSLRAAALRAAPEWQPMETAPRDGAVVLVAIGASDIPQPCRFRDRVGWVIAWDEWRIPAHDGPLGWMPLPAAARPQGVKDV